MEPRILHVLYTELCSALSVRGSAGNPNHINTNQGWKRQKKLYCLFGRDVLLLLPLQEAPQHVLHLRHIHRKLALLASQGLDRLALLGDEAAARCQLGG